LLGDLEVADTTTVAVSITDPLIAASDRVQ
jgi:hypothetical protein